MSERTTGEPERAPATKIETLELNRETIQELTESEAGQAQGGRIPPTQQDTCFSCRCTGD
jgi:hypothetical protein